jgi:hypothetical protein
MDLKQRLKLAQLPKKQQLVLLMKLSKLQAILDKEGLISFQKEEKYGFIDKNEKEIIPFMYDSVEEFSDGLAKVKLNGKSGYINKDNVQYWED